MKRRKFSLIVAVVLVMVMSLGSLSYAGEAKSDSEDTKVPILNSISMSINDLNPNEEFSFYADITDVSDTGIDRMELSWIREGTNGEGRNTVSLQTSGSSESKHSFLPTMYRGNWLIKEVRVYNNNGQSMTYNREEDYELIKTLDFTFAGSDPTDTVAPVLKSIKVVDSDYKAPGEVTIEAKITDDKSSDVNAQISYSSQKPAKNSDNVYSSGYTLKKQPDGKYRTSIELPNRYAKQYCWGVRLEDNSGNVMNYSKYADILKEVYGDLENYVQFDMDVDLIPSNYAKDTTKPELVSFSYSQEELTPPTRLYTRLDLKDDESGFDSFCGWAYFKNEAATYENNIAIDVGLDADGIAQDYYCAKLDLSHYENPGKIYLDRIVIYDRAGNQMEYSVDKGTLKKEYVTVVPESEADQYVLKTNTLHQDYIEKIANCPEGSKVLCDISGKKIIPKEFFDKLKEKDITVVFEDIYGETYDKTGIQWVVNGKDIVNETKDIDMSVTLGNDVYCYWLLKEYEFPEVEYDNTLPEEERLDKARIQQRKIAEDYWNYVKEQRKDELTAEEADRYLKKTLEIINTSDTEVSSAVMEATGYTPYLNIEFPSENGLLPCKSIVRIKPAYATRNLIGTNDLYLFYINGDKYSKEDSGIDMTADAYYDLTITHNSEYWLTQADINDVPKPDGTVKPGDSEKPGDGGSSDSGKQDPAKDNAGSTDQVKGGDNASANAANTDANAAKTGDQMNLPLLIGVMIAAAFAAILTVCMRRRKTNVK
ncbi:MAG: hypothetical protein DBY07_00225 [Clostridiales bacterium]|nr:MAG: hypothetical protein DBY07_00225 [Clostridiales bacterium]